MECSEAKNLIFVSIDDKAPEARIKDLKAHLEMCPACRQEAEALDKSWALLGEWKDIAPPPAYESRFWTELARRRPWPEKVWERIKQALMPVNPVSVFALTGVLLVALTVTFFGLRNYRQTREPGSMTAELQEEERELIGNLELVENYDLIENMDLLTDWDVIDSLEALGT